jgi:5-methyltetrahydrofolate--homocysteine methyltransferase
MKPILQRINKGEILISDGALGTMLIDRGLKKGECPEALNLTNPQLLKDIAREYLKAGADIIHTNTFGASPIKLTQYNLANKTTEINKTAVEIVREVVDNNAYISASVGPTGRILKPYGDIEPEEVYNSYSRQVSILIEAGADIICIETMTDLGEAILAINAIRDISSTISVISTMTFDETPEGFYTIMGISIDDAVKGLSKAGANIVGSNCGNGIEVMVEIASEFLKNSKLPIIIQSNAGLPEVINGKIYYTENPDFFAGKAKMMLEMGVSIIGGCCGTTPEHIKKLRLFVDEFKRDNQGGSDD